MNLWLVIGLLQWLNSKTKYGKFSDEKRGDSFLDLLGVVIIGDDFVLVLLHSLQCLRQFNVFGVQFTNVVEEVLVRVFAAILCPIVVFQRFRPLLNNEQQTLDLDKKMKDIKHGNFWRQSDLNTKNYSKICLDSPN